MLYFKAMYIESVPNRNSPPATLLRESYRDENGKVKKRTLANLSSCSAEQIAAFKTILKGGHASALPLDEQFEIQRSLPHGHVAAILGTFRRLKLHNLLERKSSDERSLAMALIAGRILYPGSKLALSRHLNPNTATSTLGQELGLKEVNEHDLYGAMRWLFDRQDKIQNRIAKCHLSEGSAVLYDLSSTYYEGSTCALAKRGHNRDGKKGKRQINFGLLTTAQGCPIAVEVFPGNTPDPNTVSSQLKTLRQRFGLKKIVIVGDRGMITSARIDALCDDSELGDFGWISALRSDQIRKLADGKHFQPELFDQRDLAEITAEDEFPGERLVVCRNPTLAGERKRKRDELLAETENKLQEIASACSRSRAPYHGKDKIARRLEREASKYKMLKHFDLEITETSLSFSRKEESIAAEAALDGFYIIRAGRVTANEFDANSLVETYKSLSGVERAFRAIKTTSLHVRPIFHHEEDMVRAHIFVCMLAYYLRWHLEQQLKPLLFNDEEPGGGPRKSPVAKAQRSKRGNRKAATKQTDDGLSAHSFATLLQDLGTLSRHEIRAAIPGGAVFHKLTDPTAIQARAFEVLGVKPSPLPHM